MSEPEIVRRAAFTVTGRSVRTSNAAEMDPSTAKIPGLWASPPQGAPLYGVYFDYESDANGPYTLLVGAPGAQGDRVVEIPEQRYAVFRNDGPIPHATIDCWREVWRYFGDAESGLRRAYTFDFEEYTGMAGVAIFIAVV